MSLPIARASSSSMVPGGRLAARSQQSRDEGSKSEQSRKEPDHRETSISWFRVLLIAMLSGIMAATLYLPASRGEYVWDDAGLITQHPDKLDDWSDIFSAFGRPATSGEGVAYYRPILIASFVVDAQLGGVTPETFHRTNVLLHALNVALVALLLAAYSSNLWGVGLGTLLFALHPIHGQAVALILGRNDQLLVPPIVGMLLADELGYRLGRRGLATVLIVLCYTLTLWTKETGIVAPIFLVLIDLLWRGRPVRSLRQRLPLFALLGLVTLLYFGTRVWVLGGILADSHYGYTTPLARLPLAIAILGYYVRHIALPWGSAPAPYHPGLVDPTQPDLWIAFLFCAGFCGAALLTTRRMPRVACGLLMFAIALLPVLGLAASMKVLILDHRTYLPMVGLALSAAALTTRAPSLPYRTAAAIVLGVLATLTARRLPAYADELSLWALGVSAAPSSDYARNNYAAALMRAGRTPEAIPELREALRLNPAYDKARFNLAACLEFEGDNDGAIREIRLLAERLPRDTTVLNRLGLMLGRVGDLAGARAAFEQAVAVQPDNSRWLRSLADILTRTGAHDEAIPLRRRLTELEPENSTHWWSLGRALASAGRSPEAVTALERAVTLGANEPQLHSELGHALWTVGRWKDAAVQAQRASDLGWVDPELVQRLREGGLLDEPDGGDDAR